MKRIVKSRLFYICVICAVFSAVFLFALRHLFFDACRNYVLRKIANETGFSDIGAHVKSFGFSHVDFDSIYIGAPDKPALSLKSFSMDYSIPGLLIGGELKKMSLAGLEINCSAVNGGVKLRGVTPSPAAPPPEIKTESNKKKGTPAFLKYLRSFRRLDISNATFNLETKNGVYSIPFNIKVAPARDRADARNFLISLLFREQKIQLSGIYDFKTGKLSFAALSDEMRFSRFQDIAEAVEGLYFSGKAEFRAAGEISLLPLKVEKLSADFYLRNASLFYSGLELKTGSGQQDIPAHVKIRGASNEIDISAENFSFNKPLPLSFKPLKCKVRISDKSIDFRGDYGLAFGESVSGDSALKIKKPFVVKGVMAGSFLTDEGRWELKLADEPGLKKNEVQKSVISTEFNEGKSFLSLIPVYELDAKGKGKDLSVDMRLKLPDIKVSDGNGTCGLRMLDLKCSAKTEKDSRISAEVSLKLEDALMAYSGMTTKIPEISISSKSDALPSSIPFSLSIINTSLMRDALSLNIPLLKVAGNVGFDKKGIAAKADFVLNDTVLKDEKSGLHISSISSEIPLKWPCEGIHEKGNIRFAGIGFGETDFAEINIAVRQNGKAFLIDGGADIRPLPSVKPKLAGKAGLENNAPIADFKLSIPKCATENPVDLGLLHPSAQDIYYSGGIEFENTFALLPSGAMRSALSVKLRDTRIEARKMNCVVDGIDLDLSMPRFLRFKSAPKQIIKFKNFSLGNINASKGTIQYQIEAADSIFIEKCSLKWCEGNVYTHAMRFVPGVNDYDLTLYCDNINLAKLLEQLASAKAEGKGSLNGKIPLKIEKGNLTFEEGFFISTPGEGGSIHLSGADILTDNIAKELGGNIEVELAKEALKSFDYEWAKLYLTTEEDNLLIRLNLDGKPSNLLPFVYKQEAGRFVKVEAESQGSRFQGIKLDVNFRLPINKILEYSKGTKSLLNKF